MATATSTMPAAMGITRLKFTCPELRVGRGGPRPGRVRRRLPAVLGGYGRRPAIAIAVRRGCRGPTRRAPARADAARADAAGYSVEMFGSACWVTGESAMKCSAGASMSASSRAGGLGLTGLLQGLAVLGQQLGHLRLVGLVELQHRDLGRLGQATADRAAVEVPVRVLAAVDDPAGHAGADPRPRVAEHDDAAPGHVLEREALAVGAGGQRPAAVVERLPRLPAEDDVRAGHADAGAGVGVALHQEQAPLGAVGKALADVAADPLALGVAWP